MQVSRNANVSASKIINHGSDLALIHTRFLRTTPLASLLLSGVANIDSSAHARIVAQIVSDDDEHAPNFICDIAEELECITTMCGLPSCRKNVSKNVSSIRNTSSKTISRQQASLWTRRNTISDETPSPLTLKDLPVYDILADDMDYMFLCHKLLESPDYLKIPMWHSEDATQRDKLDIAAQHREHCSTGFFVHGAGSIRNFNKMVAAEHVNEVDEDACLVRAKIEHFMEELGVDPRTLKALRQVNMKSLKAANISTCKTPHEITSVVTAEINKVLNHEIESTESEDECVGDIISA